MHPAYSVIVFTTASGAGYGLLVWLALFRTAGIIPPDPYLGAVGIGLGLALVSLGLISSTAHLGRPERAWRALSQWRTSWLSREGIAALVTFAPAVLFGVGWVFWGAGGIGMGLLGVLTAACALVTVACTGMIYASLRTVRQWHNALTTPNYLLLALATGAVLFHLILHAMGYNATGAAIIAVVSLATALGTKVAYWRSIDRDQGRYTIAGATGLGNAGKIRTLDPPHTGANFVMREMGFQVARKHAMRLRLITVVAGFLVPMAMLLLALLGPATAALTAGILCVVGAGVGVLIERWLFFAEAEHVSMLYYGAARA